MYLCNLNSSVKVANIHKSCGVKLADICFYVEKSVSLQQIFVEKSVIMYQLFVNKNV
jgi:hypothetical protein